MTQYRRFGTMFSSLALALAMAAPAPSFAGASDTGTFDIYIRGIRAAVLKFNGAERNGRYAAAGKLESAGVVGLLFKVEYDAASKGSVRGSTYVPSRYSEVANTGKRVSESVMEYKSGVPQVKTYKPAREVKEGDVKPSTQKGTIDPMTAIYAALRDVPKDQICALNVKMFDGARRSQITFSNPVAKEDGFVCDAEYRRLKGFTAAEMAERSKFPFNVHYEQLESGDYRVTKISMATLYGSAVMNRR